MVSRTCSRRASFERMDTNENTQEVVNKTAIMDVISSIITASVLLAICREVITNKQKPNNVAEVFNI